MAKKKPGRWEWWKGPWRERDACGAWCSMEDIENDRQDHVCRNGGHQFGPSSKYWAGQRREMEEDWRVAQHAGYLAAEAATRGYMVKRGAPAGTNPTDMYPVHPRHRPPLRWASEELLDFWQSGGQRPSSFSEFRRGMQLEFAHPLES
jgi:hypothetical protein